MGEIGKREEEKKKKTSLIVATMFCLQRPRSAHAIPKYNLLYTSLYMSDARTIIISLDFINQMAIIISRMRYCELKE